MPLIALGFIFAVGLFIYYLVSTGGGGGKADKPIKKKKNDDVKTDDNVIYLTGDIDKIKKDHNVGSRD